MKDNDFLVLKNNLPRFPGLQGREKYLNNAVLVPLIMIDNEFHFLFQKRAYNISQGSEICFPGGKYDPKQDKDYRDTAIRETVEELGIDKDKITVEGGLDVVVNSMGMAIEPHIGLLNIKHLGEIKINPAEVEKVFALPVSHFEKNKPEIYHVRLEIQPSYTDKNGKTIVLLPGKELGLPEKYHQPWGGQKVRILAYRTKEGVIWGITAEIVYEFISKMS